METTEPMPPRTVHDGARGYSDRCLFHYIPHVIWRHSQWETWHTTCSAA